MNRVLAICTCFNRKEKTKKSLNSLMEGNPSLQFSFVVVDDNSTDGTKDMLRQFPNVTILQGDGNSFYSGGMRVGIEAAKAYEDCYDWVVFFNDDVEFVPQAVERLLHLEAGKGRIVVGATCDDKGQLSYGGVLKIERHRPKFRIVMSETDLVPCHTFNANCVLIPADVFRKLPNIDPVYTHSLGDFDYGLEAYKRGVSIVASDFFVGECCDNPLTGTWRDVNLSMKQRLRKKESPKGLPRKEWFHFVKKHCGLAAACWSSLTPYLKILLRLA